jgi:hypothetical protein
MITSFFCQIIFWTRRVFIKINSLEEATGSLFIWEPKAVPRKDLLISIKQKQR